MILDEAHDAKPTTPGAPDAILAELWEVKREINQAASYRIDALVRMAHESAERVRQQWQDKGQAGKDEGKSGK